MREPSTSSDRRGFLRVLLAPPLAMLAGCGGGGDGTHVQIGDATKAEVQARAEGYKARALAKKSQKSPKR